MHIAIGYIDQKKLYMNFYLFRMIQFYMRSFALAKYQEILF